jgi:hypothetical protein
MKQLKRNNYTNLLTAVLVLAAGMASVSVLANEIYRWTDENGVVHFGDRPPEGLQAQAIHVPESQPSDTSDSGSTADEQESPPSAETDSTSAAGEEAVPLTAAQARREQMAEARKERREAQAEIDLMCQKHSKRVEQIEPYRRVYYTNEQGESVRMDDDLRIELVDESKAYIAENCD